MTKGAPDGTEEDISDTGPVSISDVLSRQPSPKSIAPPTSTPAVLPFESLDPLVFERLVAEAALCVFNLDDVQAYGRTGQYQAGLDIVGWKSGVQIVYQVRRIESITPTALENAVRDYANPSRKEKGKTVSLNRPFPEAHEFVLVTGCSNRDTAVTLKLAELKNEFSGDFTPRLIDAHALSSHLRHYGAIVGGYFGEHWAREFCGYNRPIRPGIGNSAGLIDDPLTAIGRRKDFDNAQSISDTAPLEAAQTYDDISAELHARALPFADIVRDEATRLIGNAGESQIAFDRLASDAITAIEGCQFFGEKRRRLQDLATECSRDDNDSVLKLLVHADQWYENGIEVDDVAPIVDGLVTTGNEHAGRLALLLAEQILTDEDDRDDKTAVLTFLKSVPNPTTTHERVRLLCTIADLEILDGTASVSAYDEVRDQSYTDDGIRALIERRYGRAAAAEDRTTAAINAYRRAVTHGWHADMGGDVRDALRSIASVAPPGLFPNFNPLPQRVMSSAKSISNRRRLIQGKDTAEAVALQHLVDNKVADAIRWTHHWLRLERTSGNECDERRARKFLAQAMEAGLRPEFAIRQRVVAANRQSALSSSNLLSQFIDVSAYLSSPSALQRACAADVVGQTADFIPDAAIDRIAAALQRVFARSADPTNAVDADDAVASLGAIASLGSRLPEAVVVQVLPVALKLIPRDENHYRFIDEQLIDFLIAVVRSDPHHRKTAVDGLAEMVRIDAGRTTSRVERSLADIALMREALQMLVDEHQNRGAANILATWGVSTDVSVEHTQSLAESLMSEQLNVPRTSHVEGYSCTLISTALSSALDNGNDPRAKALVRQWQEHLLERIKDMHLSASERADAASGLRQLVEHTDSDNRDEIVSDTLRLVDEPTLNRFDIEARATIKDPAARFKLSSGGPHFEAELLWTAAIAAQNRTQREAVTERLRRQLRQVSGDAGGSDALARACVAVQAYSLVVELSVSPNVSFRKAACVLWSGDSEPDPTLGDFLSNDPHVGVRATLARALAEKPLHGPRFEAIHHRLRTDPSAMVRGQSTDS